MLQVSIVTFLIFTQEFYFIASFLSLFFLCFSAINLTPSVFNWLSSIFYNSKGNQFHLIPPPSPPAWHLLEAQTRSLSWIICIEKQTLKTHQNVWVDYSHFRNTSIIHFQEYVELRKQLGAAKHELGYRTCCIDDIRGEDAAWLT